MSTTDIYKEIESGRQTWLVTGAAGFIGTNLCEKLLQLGQRVVGFDNFSTGRRENISYLKDQASQASGEFEFVEGDLCQFEDCSRVFEMSIDRVLHNGALGSVPRSIEKPLASHDSNVNGFINILRAAQQANVKRFVFASSSSVYGDEPTLPKIEERIGKPLSPYAATKYIDEVYAQVFAKTYGIETIGLRYFNVFGPHQRTDGPYAAVIPKWIAQLLSGQKVVIFGDGETSRDFCFVDNVVQINLRAAMTENPEALNRAYNVAHQTRTTLNELFDFIRDSLLEKGISLEVREPEYNDFRPGDVRHSLAEIAAARTLLGYSPVCDVKEGLLRAMDWYITHLKG